jgi:hypothetical protein
MNEQVRTVGNAATPYRQSSASAAVWPWVTRSAGQTGATDSGPRRRQALLQACVMTGIAATLAFVVKHPAMAVVVCVLAAVVLLSGLFVPPVFAAIERFGAWLGKAVGLALTWILLVPFFVLCFIPGRLVLAMRGVDPMQRDLSKDKKTYWTSTPRHSSPDYYRKQY